MGEWGDERVMELNNKATNQVLIGYSIENLNLKIENETLKLKILDFENKIKELEEKEGD